MVKGNTNRILSPTISMNWFHLLLYQDIDWSYLLIQLSLQGSAIISQSSSALQKDLFDLGKALGVNFQLFDDLCELTEVVNKHELEVNPFINYNKDILLTHIKENTSIIRSVCKTHNLNTVQSYIELYYQKIHKTLS